MEKLKNNKYSSRITNSLGCDFIPFIMTSGGCIGPAANMVLKTIANKKASKSFENRDQILRNIKTDLSMSLLKSRIVGIRSSRKTLTAQIENVRKNNSES